MLSGITIFVTAALALAATLVPPFRTMGGAIILWLSLPMFIGKFELPRVCMAMRAMTVNYLRTWLIQALLQGVAIPAFCLYRVGLDLLWSLYGDRWYCPLLLGLLTVGPFFLLRPLCALVRGCRSYGKIRAACRRNGYTVRGGLFAFLFARDGKEALRIRRAETELAVYPMGGIWISKKYSFGENGEYQVSSVNDYVAKFFREGDYAADEAANTLAYRAAKLLFLGRAKKKTLPVGPAGKDDARTVGKILLFTPRPILAWARMGEKAARNQLAEGNLLYDYRVYETDGFVRGCLGLHAAANEREDIARMESVPAGE